MAISDSCSHAQRRREKKKLQKPRKKAERKEKQNEVPKAWDGSRKDRISWPKANVKERKEMDTDITALLKTLYSSSERKAESHPKMMYAICKKRIATKEEKKTGKMY